MQSKAQNRARKCKLLPLTENFTKRNNLNCRKESARFLVGIPEARHELDMRVDDPQRSTRRSGSGQEMASKVHTGKQSRPLELSDGPPLLNWTKATTRKPSQPSTPTNYIPIAYFRFPNMTKISDCIGFRCSVFPRSISVYHGTRTVLGTRFVEVLELRTTFRQCRIGR